MVFYLSYLIKQIGRGCQYLLYRLMAETGRIWHTVPVFLDILILKEQADEIEILEKKKEYILKRKNTNFGIIMLSNIHKIIF